MTLATAICIVLKVKPAEIKDRDHNFLARFSYWQAFIGPQVLGNPSILQRFESIDPSEISFDIMKALEDLLRDQSLTEAKVSQAAHAASGLYAWINAVRTYYFVYRDSAPVRDKLLMADLQLKKLQEQRAQARADLLAIQNELKSMREEQKAREEEVHAFQQEIDLCYFTRSRAARLLNELIGEA